jgi:hypothetical protein
LICMSIVSYHDGFLSSSSNSSFVLFLQPFENQRRSTRSSSSHSRPRNRNHFMDASVRIIRTILYADSSLWLVTNSNKTTTTVSDTTELRDHTKAYESLSSLSSSWEPFSATLYRFPQTQPQSQLQENEEYYHHQQQVSDDSTRHEDNHDQTNHEYDSNDNNMHRRHHNNNRIRNKCIPLYIHIAQRTNVNETDHNVGMTLSLSLDFHHCSSVIPIIAYGRIMPNEEDELKHA